MKTIAECAADCFIIIAEVDEKGLLTKRFLIIDGSGVVSTRSYVSPREAMVEIDTRQPLPVMKDQILASLSVHAYEGFVIVAQIDSNNEETISFFIFTNAGVYEAGPFPLFEKAQKFIEDKKAMERIFKAREAANNSPARSIIKPPGKK